MIKLGISATSYHRTHRLVFFISGNEPMWINIRHGLIYEGQLPIGKVL